MTKSTKDKITGAVATLLIAIIPVLYGFKLANSYNEKQSLIEKVQELDKTKASTNYVDQKCLEVSKKADTDKQEIITRLNILDEKSTKILELMVTQKK